jgi:hypothetical protein
MINSSFVSVTPLPWAIPIDSESANEPGMMQMNAVNIIDAQSAMLAILLIVISSFGMARPFWRSTKCPLINVSNKYFI